MLLAVDWGCKVCVDHQPKTGLPSFLRRECGAATIDGGGQVDLPDSTPNVHCPQGNQPYEPLLNEVLDGGRCAAAGDSYCVPSTLGYSLLGCASTPVTASHHRAAAAARASHCSSSCLVGCVEFRFGSARGREFVGSSALCLGQSSRCAKNCPQASGLKNLCDDWVSEVRIRPSCWMCSPTGVLDPM